MRSMFEVRYWEGDSAFRSITDYHERDQFGVRSVGWGATTRKVLRRYDSGQGGIALKEIVTRGASA